MNFSLKPHQLVAHWVPGFLVVCSVALTVCYIQDRCVFTVFGNGGLLLLLAVAAFIVGQVIDSFRDHCIETWLDDHKGKMKWDFFFECKDQRLGNLEGFFWDYYVFSINLVIAVVVSAVLALIVVAPTPPLRLVLLIIVGLLAGCILLLDAGELRKRMVGFTQGRTDSLPHEGVYTRLKPSQVDKGGVGVFAIRDIRRGTKIFTGDDSDLIWHTRDELGLANLPPAVKRLYDDFCLIEQKGLRYGCPSNFNLLTVAWYLNHSKEPNVRCGDDFEFYTLKDIREGEELVVDYETYNDFPQRPDYFAS